MDTNNFVAVQQSKTPEGARPAAVSMRTVSVQGLSEASNIGYSLGVIKMSGLIRKSAVAAVAATMSAQDASDALFAAATAATTGAAAAAVAVGTGRTAARALYLTPGAKGRTPEEEISQDAARAASFESLAARIDSHATAAGWKASDLKESTKAERKAFMDTIRTALARSAMPNRDEKKAYASAKEQAEMAGASDEVKKIAQQRKWLAQEFAPITVKIPDGASSYMAVAVAPRAKSSDASKIAAKLIDDPELFKAVFAAMVDECGAEAVKAATAEAVKAATAEAIAAVEPTEA